GLLLLGHEDDAKATFPSLLQQLVRANDRAGPFVPRDFWLVWPAEEVPGVPVRAQQFLDASTQGSVGPTGLIEKVNQLVRFFAVEGFNKNRLGIGIYVAHG